MIPSMESQQQDASGYDAARINSRQAKLRSSRLFFVARASYGPSIYEGEATAIIGIVSSLSN